MALNRENVIRAAEKYVSKGKLEAAIKEYRKVLAENPNDANTLNRVGDLYARIERFDEAVKLFSQIAEQYTRDGFFVKAIAIYKKIIKLDPTSLAVYERLAELYYKQGLLNEARTQYQVLADYYQKHDNAASAITIYQKMSQMEPENPSFHLKLAELFESQRLTEKAMREYRLLADILIVNGSVDEATQVYLKALEVNSSDLDFVREAVAGLHENGHMGAAARVLAKATELNPEAQGLASEVGLGEEKEEVAAEEEVPASLNDSQALDDDHSGTFDGGSFDDSGTFDDPTFAATSFADQEFGTDSQQDSEVHNIRETSFVELPDDFDLGSEAETPVKIDQEVFTLDLDDDEVPDSLVKPPADMLDEPVGLGDSDTVIELDLDEDETVVSFGEETVASGTVADSPAYKPATESIEIPLDFDEVDLEPSTSRQEVEEVEIDWSMDEIGDLDLNLPTEDSKEEKPAEASVEEEVFVEAVEIEELEPTLDFSEAVDLATDPGTEDATTVEGAVSDSADVVSSIEASGIEEIELVDESLTTAEEQVASEAQSEAALPSEDVLLDPDPVPLDSAGADSVEDSAESVPMPSEAKEADASSEEAESAPTAVQVEDDLLAEAKVFAKYGLQDKARDRLQELFARSPNHLDGLKLQIKIHLEAGRHQDVIEGANHFAALANESGNPQAWSELRQDLMSAGYGFEGDQVVREPGEKAAEDDRIAQLLEDLSLEDFQVSSSREMPAAEPAEESSSAEPAVEPDGVSEVAETAEAAEVPKVEEEKKLISLVDELGLDELDDELEGLAAMARPEPEPEEAPVAQQAETDPFDETGMSWLDDVTQETEEAQAQVETIFDEEDDFFDLAAELERELSEDELRSDEGIIQPQEQSLEEIIEGFKQGVAENLSSEDYDTHFNLGIAYREMGLLDEAIGEFQLASKDERYIVDSSSLLGLCFLDKGLPELAVRWYRKGLEAPVINEEATLGLLYDMGNAYVSIGDTEAAYKTFVEIYGLNSNYRDVSTKLEELQA